MHTTTGNKIHEVEAGIELIPNRNKGRSKYPIATMDVGDSFFVETTRPDSVRNTARNVAAQCGRTVECRQTTRDGTPGTPKGIRVWRVADTHKPEGARPGRGSKK